MNEPEKREKVINGMGHCIGDNCNGDKWNECEYSGHGCIDALLEDALALLKAEAPRVMTPTEIAALKENDIVWYEQHGPDGDYITAMVADGRESIGNASLGVRLKYLDENERLWTSRPTDEQRAATPWKAVIR